MAFQFHNGTINTTEHTYSSKPQHSFNSTTVQLIPEALYNHESKRDCFNSTTVQLIHPEARHKKAHSIGFNSTTVQLIHSMLDRHQTKQYVSIPQRYN